MYHPEVAMTSRRSPAHYETILASLAILGGFLALPFIWGARPAPAHVAPSTADDGQWVRPARDFASTRFSGLDQINAANVSQLHLAWTFSTGVLRGQEAAP